MKKQHSHAGHESHEEFSYEDHIADVELLEGSNHEGEEDLHHSILKRISIGVMGLVLILLMVSYIFAGFPLSGIIRGQLESSPLEGNQVVVDDITLIFLNGTKDLIDEYYFSEQKTEFSLCLRGEVLPSLHGEVYSISSLYQPKQFEQTFNHVSFEPCSEETLVIFHTHPYKSCLATSTDLNTLENTQEINKNVLMVVMCEPKRFSVYS